MDDEVRPGVLAFLTRLVQWGEPGTTDEYLSVHSSRMCKNWIEDLM